MSVKVLITCEHAGESAPSWVTTKPPGAVLGTHRAFDLGALRVAAALASRFTAPLYVGTTTRALVDLNRPLDNSGLFGSWGRRLSQFERQRLIDEIHTPHWARVRAQAESWLAAGSVVLHVGAHTFTPVLAGVKRKNDVGILFDPRFTLEAGFAEAWLPCLPRGLVSARNRPYKGASDGLTTSLRNEFADFERYLGIELEVNQKHARRAGAYWEHLCESIAESCAKALDRWKPSR